MFNLIYLIEQKKLIFFNNNLLKFFTLIILLLFGYFTMNINFNNIINFKQRLNLFVNLEDEKFLNNKYKNYVNEIKIILKDENCIQLFTNSAIMPYLLKKKNCSKYYFVWSVGSKDMQNKMIKDIQNVNFILSDKVDDFHNLSPNNKLKLVKKFIDKNYYVFKSFEEFDLLKKYE